MNDNARAVRKLHEYLILFLAINFSGVGNILNKVIVCENSSMNVSYVTVLFIHSLFFFI